MDIFFLGGSTFKLKGKNVSTTVDEDKVMVEDREFSGPGEYEAKRVAVTGVPSKNGSIFVIRQDNLNLVYLGLNRELLNEEQMEFIVDTDILFVSGKSAPAVSQLEPKVIVLIGGEEKLEPLGKLSITKEKMPEEPMVVVLKHG